MCLITNQLVPEIIKEDLIVFKVLKNLYGNFYSVCYPFSWTEKKLEKCNFGKEHKSHYFKGYCDVIDEAYYKNITDVTLYTINEGFHAFLTKERISEGEWGIPENYEIKEFLIPAGAEVYRDATGLIVSNQIMML